MSGNELCQKIDKLNFSIEVSMRYHQRRRAFYERSHSVIMFLIVVLGSAAFSALVQEWSSLLVATATILAALDLVWTPSHRSRDHEMSFRRFSSLISDVRTDDESEENFAKWKKERITIEADESPIYWTLAHDCYNEVIRLTDEPGKLVKIPWWRRLTMHLLQHAGGHYSVEKSAA